MRTREETIIHAVERMKKGPFKLTGIKVELEATLIKNNRRREHSPRPGCVNCNRGTLNCNNCNGNGRTSDYYEPYKQCKYCVGTGRNICECERTREGYDFTISEDCNDFVLSKLVDCGLAERTPARARMYPHARNFRPKHPLVFSYFYRDGSVGTEHTFTLAMDDPKTVLLLPKVIEAFNAIATEGGYQVDVGGAGMHTTLLGTKKAIYPGDDSIDSTRYTNFKRSLDLMMPALYFLAASGEITRGVSYRHPGVTGSHHGAISVSGKALEFRVFDTCYDNPQQILDNVVVMANCMRYWSKTYVKTGMPKIARRCKFGHGTTGPLERLYATREHIDLLNRGLLLLKPSYYTVRELKLQRNFKVNKHQIKNKTKKVEVEAKTSYKEYEHRYKWATKSKENTYITNFMERVASNLEYSGKSDKEIMDEAKAVAKKFIKQYTPQKKSLETFIDEAVAKFVNTSVGNTELVGDE